MIILINLFNRSILNCIDSYCNEDFEEVCIEVYSYITYLIVSVNLHIIYSIIKYVKIVIQHG